MTFIDPNDSYFCKNADSMRTAIIVNLCLSCVLSIISIIFIALAKKYKYPYYISLVAILVLSVSLIIVNAVTIYNNIAVNIQEVIQNTTFTCGGANNNANNIYMMSNGVIFAQSLSILLTLILFFVKNEVAIRIMLLFICLLGILSISLYSVMMKYITRN